jgi:hypothetical protein
MSALAKLFQHEPDTPCEKCGDAVFVGVSIEPMGPKVTLCPCSAVVRRTAVEAATHAVSTYEARDEALREAHRFIGETCSGIHEHPPIDGDGECGCKAALAKIESALAVKP